MTGADYHKKKVPMQVSTVAEKIVACETTMMKPKNSSKDDEHYQAFLLPTRPPHKGMIRINTLPITDTHRKRLKTKPVKPPKPFAPTIKKVKEIVLQAIIPKIKDYLIHVPRRPEPAA